MLEMALIELVSAGLRRFFIDSYADEPPAAQADAAHAESEGEGGSALICRLFLVEPEAAGRLMKRCVSDLWHNIRAVDLPTDYATTHIELLPAILGADQSLPGAAADRGAAFFAQSPSALADAIVLAHEVDTDPDRLDETILVYLLETFLKSFHACRADIEVLIRLLGDPTADAGSRDPSPRHADQPVAVAPAAPGRSEQVLATSAAAGTPQPRPAAAVSAPPALASPPTRTPSAVTLEKIARADALSISVPILELITVALINQTRSPDLRQTDLDAAAAEARRIRSELALVAAGQPFPVAELAHLLTAFDAARFEACNRILATIEDEAVKRATARSPRVPEEVERAIAMRLLRARLHALSGAHVAAARQFGNAQRHVARTDFARRWQLAAREARHYERAAFHDRATANLEHAARACSSLLASLTTDGPLTLRAEVQSELAYHLIRLGEFEQSASRFEIAAQLLGDALDHLDGRTAPTTRLAALIRQSDALIGLARVTGVARLLDQAVAACEEASTLLGTRASAPDGSALVRRPFDESVLALRARLALALMEAPSAVANTTLCDSALETIIEVLPELARPRDLADDAGFTAHRLTGLCHHVLAHSLAAVGRPRAARDRYDDATRILSEAGLGTLARSLLPPPDAARPAKSRVKSEPADDHTRERTPPRSPAASAATAA